MISKLPLRNILATLPWKVDKFNRNYGAEVKSAEAASDKICPSFETNRLHERYTSASSNDNIPHLPFSSMPGPGGIKKLPYIGTALMFKPFTPFTADTIHTFINSLHDRHGSVFKARMGRSYIVYTDSAQDAETIFRSDGMYPKRQPMNLVEEFQKRNSLPRALGAVSGPEWLATRRPLNPLLNRPQVVLHYLPAQNQVANDFIRRLKTIKFSAEQLSEEFFKYASESIGVVCFNQRLGFLSDDLSNSPDRLQLLEAYKDVLTSIFRDAIGLERRYLKNADDPFYRKFEDNMKLIRKRSTVYVEKVMKELESRNTVRDQHSQTDNRSTEVESNLLASLIVGSKLEMENILSIIDSMLIAGTDSTARNLAVLFYNLAINPKVQAKAAKEVIDLIGTDDPIVPDTLTKMNYLKACAKESMRVNFPLPNGTGRTLVSDVVLSGYLVPKGTFVIMSSSRSSLNSKYFPDPLKFLPERWLRETSGGERTAEKKASAFAYLPFGHGPRSCIGRKFAEMEIYVAAAKVLQKLEIKVDPSYSGLVTVYKPFISPIKPIPFIFAQRTV